MNLKQSRMIMIVGMIIGFSLIILGITRLVLVLLGAY